MSAKDATRWLHVSSWAGRFAYPVELLSQGKRFATVLLKHKTHIGRTWYPAGTIKRRVPIYALTVEAPQLSMRSIGGGRFE